MNRRELGGKRSREDGEGSSSYNISQKDKNKIKDADAASSRKFDEFNQVDVRDPRWENKLKDLLNFYKTQMMLKRVPNDIRQSKIKEEEQQFKQMRQDTLAAMESAGQGGWEACNNQEGRGNDGERPSSPISAQDQQRISEAENSIDGHPNSVNNLDVDDSQWDHKVNEHLSEFRRAMQSSGVSESAIEKAINKERDEFKYKKDNFYADASSEEDE